MKRGIAFLLLLGACAIAADFTGYVIDESCAAKPGMKGNEACARKCINQEGLIVPRIALGRLQSRRHRGVAVRCRIFKRLIDVPQHARLRGVVRHATR